MGKTTKEISPRRESQGKECWSQGHPRHRAQSWSLGHLRFEPSGSGPHPKTTLARLPAASQLAESGRVGRRDASQAARLTAQ